MSISKILNHRGREMRHTASCRFFLEKNVLTKEQAHLLLKEAKAHHLEALLALAITTGMREGELLALCWQDISLEDCSLQVKRAVSYMKEYDYVVSEPKTAKSRRTIKLHGRFLVFALRPSP